MYSCLYWKKKQQTHIKLHDVNHKMQGGRDCMVVEFTTICAISVYHH